MTAPAQGSPLVTGLSLTNGQAVLLVSDGEDAVTYQTVLAALRQRDTIKGRRWDINRPGYQGDKVAVPFHAVAYVQEQVLDIPEE